MLGPEIVGERVTLGVLLPEHLDRFVAWFADLEVTRYLLVVNPPSPRQEREWYDAAAANDRKVVWGIFADGELVGSTSIEAIDWRNGHGNGGTVIGDKRYWRRGLGSETMRLRTDYAFRELNFEKMKSGAFADNAGSRRSLERAGYRQTGVARREVFREGRWLDLIHYEILREEWEASRRG